VARAIGGEASTARTRCSAAARSIVGPALRSPLAMRIACSASRAEASGAAALDCCASAHSVPARSARGSTASSSTDHAWKASWRHSSCVSGLPPGARACASSARTGLPLMPCASACM